MLDRETIWLAVSLVLLITAFGMLAYAGIDMAGEAESLQEAELELLIRQAVREEVRHELEGVREDYQRMAEEDRELIEQMREWLEEWRVKEVTATAYTHVAVPGVPDINGDGNGLTASGTQVREGVVAVDPQVIPLGTEIWVDGFGFLTAEDTGGAIKGEKIDIFIDDRKTALLWGRRKVRVAIPKEG